MVFTVEQIDEIEAKSMAATAQIRVEFGTVEEYQKKRLEQAEKLKADMESKSKSKEIRIGIAVANLPVCDDGKKAVAELVKIVTGLDIEVPMATESVEAIAQQHISFSMMVPTINENSHDYSINGPVMMIGPAANDRAFRPGGSRGNHLQWITSGLRPATDEEISTYFKVWRILSETGADLCAGYDVLGTEIKEKD
jgi:hypothetical protein